MKNEPEQPAAPICPHCRAEMAVGAYKCRECGSFIGWRHWVTWAFPAAASMLAVGLGIPTLATTYQAIFAQDKADIRQLSAAWDGAVLRMSYLNLGTAPAVFQGSLECEGAGETDSGESLRAPRVELDDPSRRSPSAVVAFPTAQAPTELPFSIWTSGFTFPEEVRSEDVEEDKDAFRRFLDGLPDLDPRTADRWYATETEAISYGSLLTFEDAFDAFAAISFKAILAENAEPRGEYVFDCTVSAEDAVGPTGVPPVRLTYSPSSYSVTFNGITVGSQTAQTPP